ncbi:MAG: hypothetical protein K2X32_03230 [Phycisphaerales bacterium]|nr:hypothetical protein [Phycisphaerales bacterium]
MNTRRLKSSLIGLACAVLCTASVATAQPAAPEAPRVRLEAPEMRFQAKDQGVGILTILMMIVIFGVAVGGSCVPSKRGHQD